MARRCSFDPLGGDAPTSADDLTDLCDKAVVGWQPLFVQSEPSNSASPGASGTAQAMRLAVPRVCCPCSCRRPYQSYTESSTFVIHADLRPSARAVARVGGGLTVRSCVGLAVGAKPVDKQLHTLLDRSVRSKADSAFQVGTIGAGLMTPPGCMGRNSWIAGRPMTSSIVELLRATRPVGYCLHYRGALLVSRGQRGARPPGSGEAGCPSKRTTPSVTSSI